MDENSRTGWRQGLWNWLALAALLALGVVFPPDAPPGAPAAAVQAGAPQFAAARATAAARQGWR